MRLRLSAPLRPDARVKDLLERALLRGVANYYRANRATIQLATVGKYVAAELPSNGLFDFCKIDKLTRRLVGIEKFRRWQKVAQVFTKRAFPGGNAARNSDRGHLL